MKNQNIVILKSILIGLSFLTMCILFGIEQISFHQSPDWELSYIITGSGTRVIGDVMETFSKGEIIFIPPMIPHVWYLTSMYMIKTVKLKI